MTTTPLLQQYFIIKEQHQNALVFFQVGDFYELFFEDAQKAAAFLGITLTKRGTHKGESVALCGVPVHALDHYLIKLVKGGFRVVICDQLEIARPGKIVERGVKQVLTPGTLTDIKLLQEKSASYCAVLSVSKHAYGLVFVELLTGNVFITTIFRDQVSDYQAHTFLEAELSRFSPDEIICADDAMGLQAEACVKKLGYVTTRCDNSNKLQESEILFKEWFDSCAVSAHEIVVRSPVALSALALLHAYLYKNQPHALEFCRSLFLYSADDYVILDAIAQRNLELAKNSADASSENTLFSVLDYAATAMGSRMIKKWIVRPLRNVEQINQRLDMVELLVKQVLLRDGLHSLLKSIGDNERVVGRIILQRATLHDYRMLLHALQTLPSIIDLFSRYGNFHETYILAKKIVQGLQGFDSLTIFLHNALNDDPENEWLIRAGYDSELDRLRALTHEGAQAIAALECSEQQRTGIQSLKIKYNHMQGYAFEITKANFDAVPQDYIRIQSLVNRDRFTTQQLKDLEYDIVRAERDSKELEKKLYGDVCVYVAQYAASLKRMSQALANCDSLVGLATAAYLNQYTRPVFCDDRDIIIEQGKHPVIAALIKNSFIPNDTLLTGSKRTWIITGPNMGGKSTFLRQTALITIMAHIGSFVPAQRAVVPLVDRIFTRIGASDNVAKGKSTFLVEMEETALICNQATEKSLIILDEVGRGTSTYDGLAIAQAVVEYLHEKIGARVLFATHYHELTALSTVDNGIVSYHAASKKQSDGSIMLLHKIVEGVADGSFGLEVAKGAHIPESILMRAELVLSGLQQKERELAQMSMSPDARDVQEKMQIYAAHVARLEQEVAQSQAVKKQLASLDYESLSPKQAFDILWDLKQK